MKNLCTIAALLLALAGFAQAQTVPLHISATNTIRDEWGQVLAGTDPAVAYFGYPVQAGGLVQVLVATNGVFPPVTNGTPDPRNAVLFEGSVGSGVDPADGPVGKFGMSVRARASLGTQIFVRVFNKPTLAESSFYGNSQLFVVPKSSYGVFFAEVSATTNMLDSADTDGDGLLNAWELSVGSSITLADTDGDGMGDFDEFRAGTSPTNASSLLTMVPLDPQNNQDMEVVWASISGKTYQVEYTPGTLLDNPAFSNINPAVTATGLYARTILTNFLSAPHSYYRVRLVE